MSSTASTNKSTKKTLASKQGLPTVMFPTVTNGKTVILTWDSIAEFESLSTVYKVKKNETTADPVDPADVANPEMAKRIKKVSFAGVVEVLHYVVRLPRTPRKFTRVILKEKKRLRRLKLEEH
ncbi:hypothetical protein HK102_004579, partial [Quaeritorhiza haematococci]